MPIITTKPVIRRRIIISPLVSRARFAACFASFCRRELSHRNRGPRSPIAFTGKGNPKGESSRDQLQEQRLSLCKFCALAVEITGREFSRLFFLSLSSQQTQGSVRVASHN